MRDLLSQLDVQSSQIRFEIVDFSAGELIRLHEDREIAIQPAFQRMFRWTQAQQSRFIESMLLGLPVPQIVLFQREDGILELIDGLQRVSSLIRFVTGKTPKDSQEDQVESTALEGCDLLTDLNNLKYLDLTPVIQLELKRKSLRAIVIRRTNDPTVRYEMFKRLNAGGSPAEAHEVRNASLRIVGTAGETFLDFLEACSTRPSFDALTDLLSDNAKRRLGRQELVLRYLALKNSIGTYRGSISDWLDNFSEAIVKGEQTFRYADESEAFNQMSDTLAEKFGSEAFLKHKNGKAMGGLAPAYFDAVTAGLLPLIERLRTVSPERAKTILNDAVGHENENFRENVGPGANSMLRLRNRIEAVRGTFERQLPAQ